MQCPACGQTIYQVSGGRMFCPNCGQSITPEPMPAPKAYAPGRRDTLAELPPVKSLSPMALETLVILARALSASPSAHHVVVVTPERDVVPVDERPEDRETSQKMLSQLQLLAPPNRPWHIVAIGSTDLAQLERDPFVVAPFWGWLQGLSKLSHGVVLFEGHSSLLERLLRGADLLLVDGTYVPVLQEDWQEVAGRVMRALRILVFDREGRAERLFS